MIGDSPGGPEVVIDLDIVERNAARMAAAVAARGAALRPHFKTHKSVRLAQMQIDAGASGVTVGNLGEAEVAVEGRIRDIFVAFPVWPDERQAERLRRLIRAARIAVGVDSVAGAEHLAQAAAGDVAGLRVLVELDSGNHRTGSKPSEAGKVAAAARANGLAVIGIFTHGGHAYAGSAAVAGAARDEVDALRVGADSLRAVGVAPEVVSAGSSPTAVLAARDGITEVRPGTYLLGDRQQVALGALTADEVALSIAATVVSRAGDGQAVVDVGAKVLAKETVPYLEGFGWLPAYPRLIVERVFDYHGVVTSTSGSSSPAVGEVVSVIPNHACPVMNLVDSFAVTRGAKPAGVWPVDARGRNG